MSGPVAQQQWEAAAAGVLRAAGRLAADQPDQAVWAVLSTRTVEDLPVPVLGIAAGPAEEPTRGMPGAPPFRRGTAPTALRWDIRALVADPDPVQAGRAVLDDLTGGATSVWLRTGAGGIHPSELPAVLDGVHLDLAAVVLTHRPSALDADSGAAAHAAIEVLSSVLRRSRDSTATTPHPACNLGADPIGMAVEAGGAPDLAGLPDLPAVVRIAADLGVLAIAVDGCAAHHGGAGDAAEVGYATAVGVAYLRLLEAAGISVPDALPRMEFRLAATDELFITIAKFRAARQVWDRVAELSGGGLDRPGQRQHAVTSWPMITRYDPWTNLLRTTVAAFGAGAGGAGAITVRPFDAALGVPDRLGRRLARTISHLLLDEAHGAESADPAGGAVAVEELTDSLAEAAWQEFQRIEAAGGPLAALADGSLRSRWAKTQARRRRLVETRRRPITGVSTFPHPAESLPDRRSGAAETAPRWAAEFEALRDRPARGELFLATLGPVAEHAARADFAANLCAAGGLRAVPAGPTASVDAVLAAYPGTGVPVLLAGSDARYAEWGGQLVTGLRAAGASWIAIAAPARSVDPTLRAVIDDTVGSGDEVVAFLLRARAAAEHTAQKDNPAALVES